MCFNSIFKSKNWSFSDSERKRSINLFVFKSNSKIKFLSSFFLKLCWNILRRFSQDFLFVSVISPWPKNLKNKKNLFEHIFGSIEFYMLPFVEWIGDRFVQFGALFIIFINQSFLEEKSLRLWNYFFIIFFNPLALLFGVIRCPI